ncbi:MAG: zf-TFIIB domain-containing protein [Candidatus Pacebacteria bacterium]|nr:zf-TFIIB domain-containing protein [Candidatus Paceibacterota bacterium]
MNCPNCENEKLKQAVFNNIGADYCPRCLGLWFEEDELRAAKDEKDKDFNWLDIDLWSDKTKFQLGAGRRACPEDSVPLYEVRYGDSDIRVDVCGQCRGVWLDRGEFKKIIGYLKDKGQDEMLNNYLANLASEAGEIFTGPEDLKEELADFISVLKFLNYKLAIQHPYLSELIKSLPK